MRTSGWHLCLLAASAFSACALADFEVHTGRTTKTDENAKFANFAKSWTLKSKQATQIESLDLSLAGTVYVSYSSDIPADVVGYVNVSGNSRAVVEAVTVSNEINGLLPDVTSLDDVFGDTKKQLSVSLGHSVDHGYLLTEIFLSSHGTVNKVSSRRTSNVVIEEDVLLSHSSAHGQKISVTGLSTVYVSTPHTAVKVRELDLLATGGGRIQYEAENLFLWQKLEVEASGDTSIKVLCPAVVAGKLELEAETRDSEICLSSKQLESAFPEIKGKDFISLPNSDRKFRTRGDESCNKSKAPPREAAQFVPVPTRHREPVVDDSSYSNDDAASENEDVADFGDEAESKSGDATQGNIFDDSKNAYDTTKTAIHDAKVNLFNDTMTAFDNAKDGVVDGAKKVVSDATGGLLGGGSNKGNVFGLNMLMN